MEISWNFVSPEKWEPCSMVILLITKPKEQKESLSNEFYFKILKLFYHTHVVLVYCSPCN